MSNPEKSYKGCGVVILALFLLSVATNVWLINRERHQPQPQVIVEHDTLWKDTTITKPVAVDSTKTGEIVYIKVPYPVPGDTIRDSIEVPIPIEQKQYEDSLYTAWVSGFMPALDSIRLHQPEIVTTITKTIVQKAPRWSIGPAVGAGVSIDRDRHMGIYFGFTAQYRLWPR